MSIVSDVGNTNMNRFQIVMIQPSILSRNHTGGIQTSQVTFCATAAHSVPYM